MHLDWRQLFDYLAESWTSEQDRHIEEHLADCDQCSELAVAVYEVLVRIETVCASLYM